MPRRPAAITQADVRRAIEAARAAGVEIGRVDVDYRLGRVSILQRRTDSARWFK